MRLNGSAGLEEIADFFGRHRPGEVEALHLTTAPALQKFQLRTCGDTLSNDADAKNASETEDSVDDRGLTGFGFDILDERLSDFDVINREAAEIIEGGIAGPEIVDGQFDTELAEADQNIVVFAGDAHQHAFGELEFEQV